MTSSGLKPATFWLVAWRLNHLTLPRAPKKTLQTRLEGWNCQMWLLLTLIDLICLLLLYCNITLLLNLVYSCYGGDYIDGKILICPHSEVCSCTSILNTLYVVNEKVLDSFVQCLHPYLLTNPIPTGKSYVLLISSSFSTSNFICSCQAVRPRSSNVPNQTIKICSEVLSGIFLVLHWIF
jgi:hypothetical protein